MDRLYRLLSFGYIPKELPPVFSSAYFAKEIKSVDSSIEDVTSERWTKPCRYLLQQRKRYRRPLSIINPNAMVHISNTIANNFNKIREHTDKSQISVSRPRFKRKTKFYRAVASEFIGSQVKERKLNLRAAFPIILKCDVKNYYRSVYTHSVPWAIHGKEYSKLNIRERNLGNDLDTYLRIGQDGQTVGLPVGPDTSFIIGEILLASIDEKLGFDQTKAIRFYDDYEFGCKSELEAGEILDRLENLLSGYELELNHEKTKLVKGPEELEGAWTQVLKDYTDRKKIRNNEDLIDLLNLASKLARDNESDFVFKYFIRRMRKTIIHEKRWDTWQNILFAAAFAEFGNLREIYEQIDLYKRIGYKINLNGLRNLLETKAANELKRGVSSELSWILFGFLKFNLKPNQEFIEHVIEKGDDVSRILSIKLSIKKRIRIKRKSKELLSMLDGKSALSEHWLLFWELYVNEWIKDDTLKSELLSDEMFTLLDSAKISFIRDTAVDLFEIPTIFKQKIEEVKGKDELENLEGEIERIILDLTEEDEGLEDYDEDEGLIY